MVGISGLRRVSWVQRLLGDDLARPIGDGEGDVWDEDRDPA